MVPQNHPLPSLRQLRKIQPLPSQVRLPNLQQRNHKFPMKTVLQNFVGSLNFPAKMQRLRRSRPRLPLLCSQSPLRFHRIKKQPSNRTLKLPMSTLKQFHPQNLNRKQNKVRTTCSKPFKPPWQNHLVTVAGNADDTIRKVAVGKSKKRN